MSPAIMKRRMVHPSSWSRYAWLAAGRGFDFTIESGGRSRESQLKVKAAINGDCATNLDERENDDQRACGRHLLYALCAPQGRVAVRDLAKAHAEAGCVSRAELAGEAASRCLRGTRASF
jgi:hypothetical protein